MRNTAIGLLSFIFVILCYFTFISAEKVFHSDWDLPKELSTEEHQEHLVLITLDKDTPFWDKVASGAIQQAEKEGASLEVWGSYGSNQDDFLKKIDIAIYSQVDGIIIQGLDTDDFNHLTKVKASSYGIPIITVANDVPMSESLRRTYVGSNQYQSGKIIAKQLVTDMGASGEVVLMYNNQNEYYLEQRLKGIRDELKKYPNIQLEYAQTSDAKERVEDTTQDILNQNPNVDAFIAVDANIVGVMVQGISKRYQIEPFYIYTFDDGPESYSLLEEGKLDALIEQSPELMGRTSVKLMMNWLSGETLPLDSNGYFTDIHILKADDVK